MADATRESRKATRGRRSEDQRRLRILGGLGLRHGAKAAREPERSSGLQRRVEATRRRKRSPSRVRGSRSGPPYRRRRRSRPRRSDRGRGPPSKSTAGGKDDRDEGLDKHLHETRADSRAGEKISDADDAEPPHR